MFGAHAVRELPVYSASSHGLDLTVVNGIAKADRVAVVPIAGIVRAVVVPHDMSASEETALGIKALASSSPRIVVVISPDHFGHCTKPLCTTQGSFRTFFGDVPISQRDVAGLLGSSDMVASSGLFATEHGVYTIMPFIRHYLPGAQVVPLTVSYGKGDAKERANIVALIRQLLVRNDVALVISSDFSHYLPLTEADSMDAQTQTTFCSGESDAILHLRNPDQSDCPLCLWVLRQEAELGGFWHPVLLSHSNSATLLGDTSVKRTTSHFAFALSSVLAPVHSCTRGEK